MNRMKKIALYIGRFQPFHKGHLHCLRFIAREFKKIIIVIGSANKKGTGENPLGAEERKEILEKVIAREKLKGCRIVLLNDIDEDEKWVEHVKENIPKFDVVFSNNELVKKLFLEKGFAVENIPFEKRYEYMGKLIRENIKGKDGSWKKPIPEYLIGLLEEFGFEKLISQGSSS